MKFKSIFHLVEDAQEICSLFDNVETTEQMISTLERLKKQFPEEILSLIQSLRLSTEAILEDTFEPGGTVGGDPDDADFEFNEGNEDVLREMQEKETVSDGKNQKTEAPTTQEK